MMRKITVTAAVSVFFTLAVTMAMASENGAVLYSENCASCHGANLEGQEDWKAPNPDGTLKAPPHDVSGHTWHHPDSMLFNYTKYGGAVTLKQMGIKGLKSGMPGFKEQFSDAQIWEILDFIKSYWPEKPANYQKKLTAQDRDK
jgi:mono/diheme cytochrome c family protein